jgi:hypothetical protein
MLGVRRRSTKLLNTHEFGSVVGGGAIGLFARLPLCFAPLGGRTLFRFRLLTSIPFSGLCAVSKSKLQSVFRIHDEYRFEHRFASL